MIRVRHPHEWLDSFSIAAFPYALNDPQFTDPHFADPNTDPISSSFAKTKRGDTNCVEADLTAVALNVRFKSD